MQSVTMETEILHVICRYNIFQTILLPVSLSTGVMRPGSEGDHSPPSRAQVKTVELYLHSPIRLHVVVFH